MSHNYLLDLSEYIDARMTSLTAGSQQAAAVPEENQRRAGRLKALKGFKMLLCQDFYPRLPKRLYRRLSENACQSFPPNAG